MLLDSSSEGLWKENVYGIMVVSISQSLKETSVKINYKQSVLGPYLYNAETNVANDLIKII